MATGEGSGIVVVDIDPRKGGNDSVAQLETEYGKFPETSEAATGGDGKHLLYAYPGVHVSNTSGRLAKGSRRLTPGIDIRGDGGYIVVAPSRHLSGSLYDWVRAPWDFLPVAMPDWLRERIHECQPAPRSRESGLSEQDSSSTTQRRQIREIPPKTLRLLKTKFPVGQRSEVEQSIILGLHNAGFSFATVVEILLDRRYPAGARLQGMTRANAEYHIRLSHERAENMPSAFRNPTDAARELDDYEAHLRSSQEEEFRGRGGGTLRAIVLAHIEIARRVNNFTHRAAKREVAKRAGVSEKTVTDSYRKLQRWLRRTSPRRRWTREAPEWQLLKMAWKLTHQLHHTNTVWINGGRTSAAHDVWRANGGLGKTCWEIWSLLAKVHTTAELAERRGTTPRAVLNQLHKLEDAGLAYCESAGRWCRIDRDLDEVARKLGVSGAGAAQERRHEAERKAFDLVLQRRTDPVVDEGTGEVVNPPAPPDDLWDSDAMPPEAVADNFRAEYREEQTA